MMEQKILKAATAIPGRGLMNQAGYQQRIDFLHNFEIDFEPVVNTELKLEQVKHNIESFIGSVEIPVGVVGPLLMKHPDNTLEEMFGAIGTTEGALVASMSRGAKAINESGGFAASMLYQKMVRTPMFTFASLAQAIEFTAWAQASFEKIKKVTKDYSNYAELLEIKPYVIGKIVHLKFIYTTGDASGQNMTTTCTWHACLWIEEHFNQQHNYPILRYVIDGNGASDKKVSYYSMQSGRGVHVVCEGFISNEAIVKHLRTTADDMFQSYVHSMAISRMDGMVGYNINVANAVAGFFAATAQDLACIHESSTGILQLERTAEGLYVSLSLPNLVIGTVGGGTHLPAQNTLLRFMGCAGQGGVERFAKIIAGFALALELSTLAAIVSGQFARAHQKLGRNKPVNWLLRSEIDSDYIAKHISNIEGAQLQGVTFKEGMTMDNGVLTELTGKVSRKVIGFIPFEVTIAGEQKPMVIKSKPVDEEVIKGLHYMASSINNELADKLLQYKSCFEFMDSHYKEIEVYEYLYNSGFKNIPHYFGSHNDENREIHLLMMEYLDGSAMQLFNSENKPELWSPTAIQHTIDSITRVHAHYLLADAEAPKHVAAFDPMPGLPFYRFMNRVNRDEYYGNNMDSDFAEIEMAMSDLLTNHAVKRTPLTLVHNDYNPRNIAIRNDGRVCIYDWELSTLNVPQRDVMELLSFVLQDGFEREELMGYIQYHHALFEAATVTEISFNYWVEDCIAVAYEYLFTRISFYLAGGTIADYPFAKRVFRNTMRMIKLLKA